MKQCNTYTLDFTTTSAGSALGQQEFNLVLRTKRKVDLVVLRAASQRPYQGHEELADSLHAEFGGHITLTGYHDDINLVCVRK